MTGNDIKWCAIGAGVGVAVLSLLAAVPSQTDFDSNYFSTNSLPISLIGSYFWTTNYESGALSVKNPSNVIAIGTNALANANNEDGFGGPVFVASHDTSKGEPNELSLHWSVSDGGPHLGYGRGAIMGVDLTTNSFNFSLTSDTAAGAGFGTGPQIQFQGYAASGFGPLFLVRYLDGFNNECFFLDPHQNNEYVRFSSETTVLDNNPLFKISNGRTNTAFNLLGSGAFSAARTNQWKTGPVVTGVSGLTLVTTNYLEFVVDGVTNKVALVK